MHLALYRSERPERFDEIIGQKHIVKILQNQVKTGNVRQAYLFTGTRGTGKTTTARILAKALNCTGNPADGNLPCGECDNCKAIKEGRFIDVVELDAASNNSVMQIRDIIENCQFPPMFSKYKIYIIDEVHMLSISAENAFLKTLEEPPKHVIFILATTDPGKVRETIRSRCMRLDFRRVSEAELVIGLRRICDRKNIDITDEALSLVAQKADGSVRDALSILEQCISGGDVHLGVEEVQDYLGIAGLYFYLELTQAVIERDMNRALTSVNQMIRSGKDAKLMLSDWMGHYRDLMVSKYVDDAEGILSSSKENVERMRAQASQLDSKALEDAIRLLSEYVNLGRYSTQPRILLETAILHLMNGEAVPSSQVDAILRRAPKTGVNLPKRPMKAVAVSLEDSAEEMAEELPKPEVSESEVHQFEASKSEATKPTLSEFKAAASPLPMDLDTMWNQIVDEVASDGNSSFRIFVGCTSYIDEIRNGEIIIKVKSNKLAMAEDNRENILAAARKLFGENIFITLREDDGVRTRSNNDTPIPPAPDRQTKMDLGQPNAARGSRPETSFSQNVTEPLSELTSPDITEPDGMENADSYGSPTDYALDLEEKADVTNEIVEEAGALFGMTVNVVD